MKAIINYFKQRRERKLRQWCMQLSSNSTVIGADHIRSAQKIYDWVRGND